MCFTHVDGVGSITVFGARDYSMQVWLDPDRLQSLGLTANDVTVRCWPRTSRRLRRAQSPADPDPLRVPNGGANPRPARDPGGFAPSSSSRRRTPWCRLRDVARDRAGRPGLFVEFLPRSRPRGRARDLPAPGLERTRPPPRASKRPDGRNSPNAFRPASPMPSSTIRPSSFRNRSTPSSTPSAKPSCSSCWS